MLNKWYINGTNITEKFGVVLKKGAYDALLALPEMKEYLTEDTRERDGESVTFYNPRRTARDVELPIYIISDSLTAFFPQYDKFVKFVSETPLELKLESFNRFYYFYYKKCSTFTNLRKWVDGKLYIECSLTLREPNPSRVLEETILAQETGDALLMETGDEILIKNRI